MLENSSKKKIFSKNHGHVLNTYKVVKSVVPPTPLVVRSGSRKRRHNNYHRILRKPPNWRRLDAAGETTNTARIATNREKQSTHKFNEVRQRAYILGTRERDFINSTINTPNTRGKLEGIFRNSFGIQYMRPLASIYSHRDPRFMKTQVGFNPNQKRNSNPKRKLQPRLSVDRPGQPRLPESEATSVG